MAESYTDEELCRGVAGSVAEEFTDLMADSGRVGETVYRLMRERDQLSRELTEEIEAHRVTRAHAERITDEMHARIYGFFTSATAKEVGYNIANGLLGWVDHQLKGGERVTDEDVRAFGDEIGKELQKHMNLSSLTKTLLDAVRKELAATTAALAEMTEMCVNHALEVLSLEKDLEAEREKATLGRGE